MFLKGFGGDVEKSYARASKVATEAVSSIRTVAAFSAEQKVVDLFVRELDKPKKQTFVRVQIAGFGYGLSQFFLFSSYGIAIYYGSILVRNHTIAGLEGFAHLIKSFIVLMISALMLAETLTTAPDMMMGGKVPDPKMLNSASILFYAVRMLT